MSDEVIKLYYTMWCEAWKRFRKWLKEHDTSTEYASAVEKEMREFIDTWKPHGIGEFTENLMKDIYAELAYSKFNEEENK